MPIPVEIIKVVEQWCQQISETAVVGREGERSFAESEELARQLGQHVAQVALKQLVSEEMAKKKYRRVACECGATMKAQRLAEKRVRSLVGEIRYHRMYYYCRRCGAGRYPADVEIGQSARAISAGVERVVGLVGAYLSFGVTGQILQEVAGVELSGRQCETVAEALGSEAEQLEQQAIAQSRGADLQPALRLVSRHAAPAVAARGRVWVVEMDGIQAPLQHGSWQEVKCAVVYQLSQRVEVSRGRWELLDKQRCVLRGTAEDFRERLWALLRRVGVRVGERIVVLGDGAEWIDQTVAELFVSATRIYDFYHVAERVWSVASVRYGESSQAATVWAQTKLQALKAGEVSEVCHAIKLLKMPDTQAEQTRQETLRYLHNHQDGMAYDEYKADGLPIGSGAVEGTCKYLVTARCKQAGMRWTETGLDAILALRCWVLNGRLDQLRPKPNVKIDWEKAA